MSATKSQISMLLTNVSNQYSVTGAIADDVLPLLTVKQSTGIIGGYGLGHVRQQNDLIGGRGEARRVDEVEYDLTKGYVIQNHGLEDVVTPDDYANVLEPFDAEVDKTEELTSLIVVNKEIIAQNALMNPAVITTGVALAGNQKFSDLVNSSPLTVSLNAKKATLAGCGKAYNAVTMSMSTFFYLQRHPELFETLGFKYSRAGLLSKEDIARALDVEFIHIGDASYNSAKKGQTDSLTQIWGSSMLFYYKEATAKKKQVCLGYMVRRLDAKARRVFKAPLHNPPESMSIIAQDLYTYKIVNAGAGYLVQSTY